MEWEQSSFLYEEWGERVMITGELKNKIDSLWDVFAAGGLTTPLEVIEQIKICD